MHLLSMKDHNFGSGTQMKSQPQYLIEVGHAYSRSRRTRLGGLQRVRGPAGGTAPPLPQASYRGAASEASGGR